MSEKLCLKPKEAAAVVGVSPPVMYDLCRREDFPTIRIGRAILIPVDSLKVWLEQQTKAQRNG